MKTSKENLMFVVVVVVCFVLGFVSGCNTVNGFGHDLQCLTDSYAHDANNK